MSEFQKFEILIALKSEGSEFRPLVIGRSVFEQNNILNQTSLDYYGYLGVINTLDTELKWIVQIPTSSVLRLWLYVLHIIYLNEWHVP